MRQPSVVVRIVLLMALAGCGSDTKSPTRPTPTPTPTPQPTVQETGLKISGDGRFTALNQVHQFTATAQMSDGSTRDVTAEAVWSSSDNSVVTASSSGAVTSSGPGLATISATTLANQALLDISVVPPADASRLSGLYHLVFTAAPECSGLPDWARRREYDAVIDQSAAESPGTLTPLMLSVNVEAGKAPQFSGTVRGSRVNFVFPLDNGSFYYYYGYQSPPAPVFTQTIDNSSEFMVDGEATGTKGASAGVQIAGLLNGTIRAMNPTTKVIISECVSQNHQFSLVRQ